MGEEEKKEGRGKERRESERMGEEGWQGGRKREKKRNKQAT